MKALLLVLPLLLGACAAQHSRNYRIVDETAGTVREVTFGPCGDCRATSYFADGREAPLTMPQIQVAANAHFFDLNPDERRALHRYYWATAFDAATTLACLSLNPAGHELNPLLGRHPSLLKLVAFKGAAAYGVKTLVERAKRFDPQRDVARSVNGSALLTFLVGVGNLRCL